MINGFNVSEQGHGSYGVLGILRWVMVLIFISFGIQKFTPQSAHGIALYISNSPIVSWLSIFGVRGEADLLGILRWVMVLIFVSFGIQKFTPQSADRIAIYISNSPFVSWLSIFGIRGEANLLGVIELTTAALLAAGAFIPILSALGSLMGIGTFAITWSFFFSTPGVVKWSVSTDPIAWNLTGEFLYKDIVLLCVCVVLFLTSLPKRVIPLRSN